MSWYRVALTLYVVAAGVWLVLENRRPQSTFAWMFLFFLLPVVGLVVYVLFGRERKVVGRRRTLLRQDLPGHLARTLDFMDEEHARALRHMAGPRERSRKVASLVHSNSRSHVTTGNRVRLLQNAEETYPAIEEALRGARRWIHLQH